MELRRVPCPFLVIDLLYDPLLSPISYLLSLELFISSVSYPLSRRLTHLVWEYLVISDNE